MKVKIKRVPPEKSFIELITERLGLSPEEIQKFQQTAKKRKKAYCKFSYSRDTPKKR